MVKAGSNKLLQGMLVDVNSVIRVQPRIFKGITDLL